MADTDPEALEREIERTRAELAVTVDAIVDRVSPKRVAGRGVARVKADAEHLVATARDMVGLGPRPWTYGETYGEEPGWQEERSARDLAPVLIAVGAVVVVGAAIALWRRRR
ncbi:hypothetical protein Sme01_39770 [Sphaerisporangium melleum]|uniref:DUF3618 domain-containing protein n=1 Tax=Sphaerisporangium melleum TaxID=321316 RepID=A0A917R3I8_9ACTN|nr:DUF3618 domain-containing protein [Sphaerisporangium melleum]GGK86372.1 hypothetical protein GCM10007964_31190 [Sphaerisporangium melleum]GII71501.1 hypothetical protein Sme01_39770 [Sphaerisporangium melleum]